MLVKDLKKSIVRILKEGYTIQVSRSILGSEQFLEMGVIELEDKKEFYLLVNSYKIQEQQLNCIAYVDCFVSKIEKIKNELSDNLVEIETTNKPKLLE